MSLELGPRQRATVAAALTVLSAVVILAAIGAALLILGVFFRTFSQVFLPVAVAGIAALVVKPYYDWLLAVTRAPRIVGLVLVLLSILLPVAGLLWLFGALLVEQLADLLRRLPEWWEAARAWATTHWPDVAEFFRSHPVGVRLREALAGQQENLLAGLQVFGGRALSLGAGALRGIGTLFAWAVVPVYFAFFLMAEPGRWFEGRAILPFLKQETRDDVMFLAREFVSIIVAFFRGQILIAFLQGVLFAAGFSLVGLRYGLLLGLLLGFLNVIPYLGSIVGLGIALPLAFFQPGGGLKLLVAAIVVFVVVQMIEGYLLTPKIMGDRTGLHPMAIMIAIFFWGAALGGILGMILAIPLTAFLVVSWRLLRERYITEVM